MISQTKGATLIGIDAALVEIEVDLQGGKPDFILVGLPDQAVAESRDRVRTAIRNCDLDLPSFKIICNLAPGDIRKEGPALDLPIAACLLAGAGQIQQSELEDTLLVGELGLDGKLRSVNGALNIAIMCKELGISRLILPLQNAPEAAVVPGVKVFGLESLSELVRLFNYGDISPFELDIIPGEHSFQYEVDFADVKGQRQAVRALEIVAAGGHNLLMIGPPGSGKTMLARRLVTILPPLTLDEAIEVTRIYSASGKKSDITGLMWERPFRSPHHTTSYAALVGGGKTPKPGEVSLSHKGVLFLDELAEFPRDVLESLRQPLEDRVVTISRVQASLTFPAACMLVGAMNPCPCGLKGYPDAKCVGSPATCGRYLNRLSGPLLDRIDLHITVPRLKPDELMSPAPGEASEPIRERVRLARVRQYARLGMGNVNSAMSPAQIRELIELDDESLKFLKQIVVRLNLSARVYDRILKVAQTICDLEASEKITRTHIAEAVQYREKENE